MKTVSVVTAVSPVAEVNHPLNVYPSLVGVFGRLDSLPPTVVISETIDPPFVSNVTVYSVWLGPPPLLPPPLALPPVDGFVVT